MSRISPIKNNQQKIPFFAPPKKTYKTSPHQKNGPWGRGPHLLEFCHIKSQASKKELLWRHSPSIPGRTHQPTTHPPTTPPTKSSRFSTHRPALPRGPENGSVRTPRLCGDLTTFSNGKLTKTQQTRQWRFPPREWRWDGIFLLGRLEGNSWESDLLRL